MIDKQNAFAFSFPGLTGNEPIVLKKYEGQVLLIVNTASHCGFTKQYRQLQELYNTYKDRGLCVIATPSNDFGGQEPGSHEEIATFCETSFGVTFPVTGKVKIRGAAKHPFYDWAYQLLGFGSYPKWNFHKYLISREGRLTDYFYSLTQPTSRKLVRRIEALLDEPSPRSPSL